MSKRTIILFPVYFGRIILSPFLDSTHSPVLRSEFFPPLRCLPWLFFLDLCILRTHYFLMEDPVLCLGEKHPLEKVGLKNLLQHHSSKASILRCSAFSIVQLSHPYLTTVKTIAFPLLAKQSVLFTMISRLVIAFLQKSNCLLILWLQLPPAVIWEPPKIKSVTVSTVFPSISHEVMGLDAMILIFRMLSFKPAFSLSSFTFIKRLFYFFFAFFHKGGVICTSEVIDISPSNLDSRLCFTYPGFSHDVLRI